MREADLSAVDTSSYLQELRFHRSPSSRPSHASSFRAFQLVAGVLLLTCVQVASAYRPFDSTDAAVAGPGEFELELGPLGRLREGSKRFRVAPAVIGNLGFSGDRELVIQGQREVALDREPGEPGEPASSIVDNGIFIKQVLRPGVLQHKSGPSIATEYGFLLPAVRGERGTGFSVAGILSQRWEAATLHLNVVTSLTRDHEPDLFLGAILEGPHSWVVRPVAELFVEQGSGHPRLTSRLIGAIWRVRENLSFDVGMRSARTTTESIHEFRVGLTWALSWKTQP
jgi:hypothetical protein